jgi:hypothetical protein
VPPEGYPVESRAFDDAYTALLGDLQTAWNSDAGDLGGAIGAMGDLGDLAADLMTKPLPDGSGNFGPDFKLST